MSETKTKQAEARSTGGESTGGDEIEMEVVRVQDLPEKFRPPSSRKPTTADPVTNAFADLPGPVVELIREATSELTDSERRAFIHRLKRETPELFFRGKRPAWPRSASGRPEES
jgi:hypothetical protein